MRVCAPACTRPRAVHETWRGSLCVRVCVAIALCMHVRALQDVYVHDMRLLAAFHALTQLAAADKVRAPLYATTTACDRRVTRLAGEMRVP